MSEYQYYEFRALDRALSKEEQAQVRKLSTRAEITPTSFTNVYTFGNFKGDPVAMMTRWYDAHVYTTNWGTHELMFAFPQRLLDIATARRYELSDSVQIHGDGERTVVALMSYDEEGAWEDDSYDDWLDQVVSLRGDLAEGDLRPLYIGWLAGIERDFGLGFDDETGDELLNASEPPVPPGLRELNNPLKALVTFLRVEQDLLAVASGTSGDLTPQRASMAEIDTWLQTLPVATKDAIILRVLAGEGAGLRLELLRRFREATETATDPSPSGRTIRELLSSAHTRAVERRKREAEAAAKEHARKERAAAAARIAYLDGLSARQHAAWSQIESLIDSKKPASYDAAVRLLVDLRDLGLHLHQMDDFEDRLNNIRHRHGKKPSFIERLDGAGL